MQRRPFLKGATAAGVTLGTAGFAGCLGGVEDISGDEEPVNLTFVSFDEGTGWYAMASAIGDHLTEYLPEGSSVSVRPFGGSVGSIELLREGEADLAINHPVTTRWAMNSEYVFEGDEPYEDLRGLVGHLDTYWTLVGFREQFTNEYGIEEWSDLLEAEPAVSLGLGPTGGVSNFGTRHSFEAHDITLDDIEAWGGEINYMELGDMTSAMQGGDVDAIGWVATPGHPTWTEITTNVDTRFLPMENKEYMTERGWLDMPDMPEGMFGNDEPIPGVGWRSTLLASSDLPDSAGYAVPQTVTEEIDSLQDAYAALEVYDPELGSQQEWLGVDLHDGALEYFEEEGYR